jgi:exonuclease SbcD
VQDCKRLGLPLPILASGHLTTVGASSSESVRDIYVGALDAFPTMPFRRSTTSLWAYPPPAAGGAQSHIRYSGSPLALSFDELGQSKQMLLMETAARRAYHHPLAVPCFQPWPACVARWRSCSAASPQALAIAAGQVLWLEITVEGDDYLSDLQGRIQAMLDGQPAELLRLRRARSQQAASCRQNAARWTN